MKNNNELSDEKQNGNLDKPMLTTVFLAPYLPYGLKIKYREHSGVLFRLWQDKDTLYVNCINGIGTFVNPKYPNEFKPILNPISDLTRPELENAGFRYYIDYLTYENQGVEWTLKAPYDMIVYLLSQHYDIYGLIEKGLAISIHDVE